MKNLLPTRLLDRVYSGDYQKLRNRKQLHCLLSYVLPADEHKVRIRNCNKRACIPKVENACAHSATRLFPSERGREEEKRGERVLPRETLYDYLQPPSNAVHLAPLTWWITSFYDGNGSLRRAGIKGGERRGLAGLLSLVIGDRFSAAFRPPDGSPDFSDRFDTRRDVSALWRPLSWLAASLGPIYLLLPIAKRKVDGDDESFAS